MNGGLRSAFTTPFCVALRTKWRWYRGFARRTSATKRRHGPREAIERCETRLRQPRFNRCRLSLTLRAMT